MNKIKGLNQTTGILGLSTGESPHARNAVLSKNKGVEGISNEEGFTLFYDHPKCILGVIPTNEGRYVIFSGRVHLAEIPEIGIYENGAYTALVADTALNFSEPIEGTFYYNNKGELIVAWCDGTKVNSNPPRILNVDCLPFKVNINKSFVNDDDVELLSYAPKTAIPDYNLKKIHNIGGILKTGAYFFTIAEQHEDDTIGNFIGISSPIFINVDTSDLFTGFNGTEPNIETTKAIELEILNLSPRIKKCVLGVIRKIGSTYTAMIIRNLSIFDNQLIYTYSGLEGEESSLEELLINSVNINKAETITQLQNRLYLGNVELPDIPNIQPFVNGIQVKYVFENELIMSEKTNSGKDMLFMLDKRMFKSNEVYALYLIGHLHTGEMLAFHIPGRPATLINYIDEDGNTFEDVGENDLVSAIIDEHPTSTNLNEALKFNTNTRLHEVASTAKLDGTMGYWENQNEFYPDTDCFDILDETYTLQGTLRNSKVRHHKFPSLNLLKNLPLNGGKTVHGEDLANLKIYELDIAGWGNTVIDDNGMIDYFDTDFTDPNEKRFIAKRDCKFMIHQNYYIGLFQPEDGIGYIEWVILKETGFSLTNEEVQLHRYDFPVNTENLLINDIVNVDIKKGEILKMRVFRTAWVVTAAPAPISTPPRIIFYDWNFDNYNVKSNLLGIKLQNIKIPNELRSKFARFELGFAERTEANSTVHSSICLNYSDNVPNNTFTGMSFDSFIFNKKLDADYLETQLAYTSNYNTSVPFKPTSDSWGITDFTDERGIRHFRKIKEIEYLPLDISATAGFKDESISIRLDLDITPMVGFEKRLIKIYADLKKYKTDVYSKFELQNVVRTNAYINNNSTSSSNLLTGDVFFNLVGWYKFLIVKDETNIENWSTPVGDSEIDAKYLIYPHTFVLETIANTNLLTTSDTKTHSLYDVNMSIKEQVNNRFVRKKFVYPTRDNIFAYNSDYHSILNFLEVLIYDCKTDCDNYIYKYPFRIYRSNVNNKDSNNLNWRKILPNNYYELERSKGPISVLRSINRSLLINTWFSFFVAGPKDVLATNTVEAFLAIGDIFDRPPEEQVTDIQGYGGCQNKFAAFVSKMGYFFVDRDQGKPFLFNGRLLELQDDRMRNQFRDLIKSGYTELDLDNPFYSKGLTAAFDEKHNRIIFSKIARISFEEPSSDVFTISYSFLNNSWISYHDYIPSYMFYNRKGLFSLDNGTPGSVGKIYQHNKIDVPQYYDGVKRPFFIDIVINSPNGKNAVWYSVEWESYAKVNNIPTDSNTFTHIFVYTDHQCTQLTALNKLATLSVPTINIRNEVQKFRFNKLEDYSSAANAPMVDAKGNLSGNINAIKAFYKRGRFFSKTIIVRFYDNSAASEKNITLVDFGANSIEFER